MRAAASASPRKSSIIAADRIAASGLAFPVPTMSGAEPCTGSNSDGPARAPLRELEAESDAALDTHPGVDRPLRGDFVRRALAEEPTLAGVDAFGVLADHDEVDARVRCLERSQVDVEVELEPQLEEQA